MSCCLCRQRSDRVRALCGQRCPGRVWQCTVGVLRAGLRSGRGMQGVKAQDVDGEDQLTSWCDASQFSQAGDGRGKGFFRSHLSFYVDEIRISRDAAFTTVVSGCRPPRVSEFFSPSLCALHFSGPRPASATAHQHTAVCQLQSGAGGTRV